MELDFGIAWRKMREKNMADCPKYRNAIGANGKPKKCHFGKTNPSDDAKQDGHCQQTAKSKGDLNTKNGGKMPLIIPMNGQLTGSSRRTFSLRGPSLEPGVKMPKMERAEIRKMGTTMTIM